MLATIVAKFAARLKVVAAVFALAVAGGTGTAVALTASAGPSHPSTVQATESESPEPSESPEARETPEPKESEPADDQGDDNGVDPTQSPKPSATPCPGGLSHGEFVSKVAQNTATGQDSEHGKTVSAAAHMDCGKGDDANENEGADDQGDNHGVNGHQDDNGDNDAGEHGANRGPGNQHPAKSGDDGGDNSGNGGDHGGHGSD
jgi:hypothetical protein